MTTERALASILGFLSLLVGLNCSVLAQEPTFASLPPTAQNRISATLGRDIIAYEARTNAESLCFENMKHELKAKFKTDSVSLQIGASHWGIVLEGYGYGDVLRVPGKSLPEWKANRVEYRRGILTEWYVNGPAGLEQGFTFEKRPGRGNGKPLVIALSLPRHARGRVSEESRGIEFRDRISQHGFSYGGLVAYDAVGRELPAWFELKSKRLLIEIADNGAQYPVEIDPVIQLAKVTASDGVAGDTFGISVVISGNTVVAGAPYATVGSNSMQGAAYVFVEPEAGWSNMTQMAKLTASDGDANNWFGGSVAVSGNTVTVGAVNALSGQGRDGAVYVYVEPPTGWANMTQTAKLTASDEPPFGTFGLSIAINGNTVVAGAPSSIIGSNQGQGAAYLFVKPPSGWTDMTETAKLTASDGGSNDNMGYSVSVSGNTVLAGSPGNNGRQGAVYVFVQPPTGWQNSIQTAKLTASDGASTDFLGNSVSISGNTVVAGAPFHNNAQGEAYVFVKPTSGWVDSLETARLSASDGTAQAFFGLSTAIGGNLVVVGAPSATVGFNKYQGEAYEFIKPAGGWATMRETAKVIASDGATNDNFGYSVSVSGGRGAIGADGFNNFQGAAYIFQLFPSPTAR